MFLPGHNGRPAHIPNDAMKQNNQAARVPLNHIPTPQQAVDAYEADGGHLTHFSPFGNDPLSHSDDLIQQRDTLFSRDYQFDYIFHQLVNDNSHPFRSGLSFFIHLSKTL